MTSSLRAALLTAAILASSAAFAREQKVAVPAGTAAEAVITLARQTNSNIVIADSSIARKPVPAIKGRMDTNEAVQRIANAAGAKPVRVGPSSWRLIKDKSDARPGPATKQRQSSAVHSSQAPDAGTVTALPIVVTATKRDLKLSDVPAQTSLIDGAGLVLGGVGGTDKIVERLASVSSTHLGSGRNKLFIRGIADSSFSGPTQATVGQYIGDLRLNYGSPDPDLRLSDIDKVEVLEGPQGTLYGAGSLGGVIRIVPNEPVFGETQLSMIAGLSATQGGDPGADANVTFNLPLDSENTALRATFDASRMGGFIDKPMIGRPDANQVDIASGRITLLHELAPDWRVSLSAIGQRTNSADSQYSDGTSGPLTNSSAVAEGADARFGAVQAVVEGRLGKIRLRSTTGFVAQSLEERYDASSPAINLRFIQGTNTEMVSHETRLWMPESDGLSWLAGASFIHSSTDLHRSIEGAGQRTSLTGVRNTIEEATIYGEAGFRIRDFLLASAGARLTWSHLSGAGQDVLPSIAIMYASVTASRDSYTFLPSASLTAELGERSSIYIRYQEGFRPGGLSVESEFVKRFEDDHTQTFEIGGRHGAPGFDDFDFSMNFAYTRWENIQADYVDASGLPSTANIGNGRVWSGTASLGWKATTSLRIEAGATVNQSKVQAERGFVAVRARQIPNIADVSLRLAAEWQHELSPERELFVRSWLGYVGRSRLGVGPELGELQGDYVDSGISARLGSERTGFTLSVTNLTDARGNRFSLGTPFDDVRRQVTPLQPRTIRFGYDHRF